VSSKKENLQVACINSQTRKDHKEFQGENKTYTKFAEQAKSTIDKCKITHMGGGNNIKTTKWTLSIQKREWCQQCQDEEKHLLSEQPGSRKANTRSRRRRQGRVGSALLIRALLSSGCSTGCRALQLERSMEKLLGVREGQVTSERRCERKI